MPGYQDPDCTIFVSNIDQKVKPEHLWELFLQAGPLRNVHIPKERSSGKQRTFGFVTYRDEVSVSYACELFNTLKLFDRPIYCKPSGDGGKQTPNQTPQSQEKKSNLNFNRNNSFNQGSSHLYNQEQNSPQDYYRDNNQENMRRQSSYNRGSPRYPENQNRQNYGGNSPGDFPNSSPRRHNYSQDDQRPFPGLHHSMSSPANLNFAHNSPFMRQINQFANGNNMAFNSSPFHESPSNHGPMRSDRDRNYQHSRMNRRQQGYPY